MSALYSLLFGVILQTKSRAIQLAEQFCTAVFKVSPAEFEGIEIDAKSTWLLLARMLGTNIVLYVNTNLKDLSLRLYWHTGIPEFPYYREVEILALPKICPKEYFAIKSDSNKSILSKTLHACACTSIFASAPGLSLHSKTCFLQKKQENQQNLKTPIIPNNVKFKSGRLRPTPRPELLLEKIGLSQSDYVYNMFVATADIEATLRRTADLADEMIDHAFDSCKHSLLSISVRPYFFFIQA